MRMYEHTNTVRIKYKKEDHDEGTRTGIYTANKYGKKLHLHVLRTMVFSFILRDAWLEITQSSSTAGLGPTKNRWWPFVNKPRKFYWDLESYQIKFEAPTFLYFQDNII